MLTTPRICIVVDHPLRDLEGLVLLACHLAAPGVDVFLVPMYQRYEVLLLQPDIVIVNYVRFANLAFIDTCRRAGIAVVVLDTEGGVQQDLQTFARRVGGHLDKVDLYCLWGPRQRDALSEFAQGRPVRLAVTGAPRYDFAAAQWQDAIRDRDEAGDGIVLVNTNFPILNPRFQSVRTEVRELVTGIGYDRDFILAFIEQARVAQRMMADAVKALALDFTELRFVIRPHPFEATAPYVEIFEGMANVRVIQEGTVLEWIRRARLVLHHSCSTAIETFLMGKEPVALRWIPAPLLEQPVPLAVSQFVWSPGELARMVEAVAGGGSLPIPTEVAARRHQVIADFFCANDGQSACRVADAVRVLFKEGIGSDTRASSTSFAVLRTLSTWRGRAQWILLSLLGTTGYERLRHLLRRRLMGPKTFTATEVAEIHDRLIRVARQLKSVTVTTASSQEARFRLSGSLTSVKLSLKPSSVFGARAVPDGTTAASSPIHSEVII